MKRKSTTQAEKTYEKIEELLFPLEDWSEPALVLIYNRLQELKIDIEEEFARRDD